MLRKVKNKTTKRVLAIIISAMMLITMSVPVAFATDADISGWWTDSGNYDTSWYTGNESAASYTLSDAADLAGLAYLVNNGNSFADKTINLSSNVDLSAHYWTPIGGASTMSSGVPSGNFFAGVFNGNKKTISNMNVTYISGDGGYGLFGSVKGGKLLNITLSGGSVDMGTNNVSSVGSFAGYCSGDIYNCHNQGVAVTVNNTSSSMCGGIVGTAENAESTPVYIQYCSNTGKVTGRGRVGGIAGAVYCTAAGGIVVDNCVNKADLTTVGSTTKSYLGGIVGYCRGYITNCYSYDCHIETNGGHYQAGLVGLLQASSPMAQMSNSYAYTTFGDNANVSYDRWLFATVDSSSTMPLSNLLWVNTKEIGSMTKDITQPDGASGTNWGLWSKVGYFASGSTEDSLDYSSKNCASVYTTGADTARTYNVNVLDDVLNSTSTLITDKSSSLTCRSIVAGAFSQTDGTVSGGYPYLRWETDNSLVPDYSGTGGGTTSRDVYLDGTKTVDGSGTAESPYNNLTSAITGAAGGKILVSGTVTLGETEVYNGIVVERASGFSGTLFNIDAGSGKTAEITTMTVDGNGTGTLFNVTSGILKLRGGITLKNCDTAVNVTSAGSLVLNRANIDATNYSVYTAAGANVEIGVAEGQTFSMTGKVYLATGNKITFSDPVPCNMEIECQTQAAGTVIAEGSDGYTVTQKDADRMTDSDNTYGVMLREMSSTSGTVSELILAKIRYLDGTQSSNGNGTANSPYNNLASALNNITGNEMVVVQGTTQLPGGTYSSSTVIQRGANLKDSDPMFKVTDGQTVMLSWKTITGRGRGVTMFVNGGTVRLSGGISLINCNEAIDVGENGNVDIVQAVIDATSYSIWMGAYSGTLEIGSSSIINISGPIYLSSGKSIKVTSTLSSITGTIAVKTENTASGTLVATCPSDTAATESVGKITVNGSAARVQARTSNIII